MIGRIERKRLRDVWRHEALDFTTWLEQNIDVLGEAIGIELSGAEREQAAGAFSVDLIAEDDAGAVVIENQLEKSNHDHLGKLLTYLVAIQAKKAIWIVSEPRPEHIGVISWLNESTFVDFYLMKLEAIQIGESDPAPLLTKIAGPSEEIRTAGRAKKDLVERERLRFRFFERLLEVAKTRTRLHANISPTTDNWIGAGAGKSGVSFLYRIRRHDALIELYIDTRDGAENEKIFQSIFRKKEKVEEAFGSTLEWDSKQGRQSCRIVKTYDEGGYRDESEWSIIHDLLSEGMSKLEAALKPHI